MGALERVPDFLQFRARRSYLYRVPMEPPIGAKELFFFESCTLAALPKEFKRFRGETGLGFYWKSCRGLWNKNALWYHGKIRRTLVKLGMVDDPNLVFSIGCRIVDGTDPEGLIVLVEE